MKKTVIILLILTAQAFSQWYSISETDSNLIFNGIEFVNNDTGYVITFFVSGRYSWVFKTTNGGLNWFPVLNTGYVINYDAKFLNENTGFVLSDQRIYKTTNAGTNWISRNIDAMDSEGAEIDIIDSNLIYTNFKNGILKSTDGGLNWQEFWFGGKITNSLDFVDANTGYVFAKNTYNSSGWIYKTTNGSANWMMVSPLSGGPYLSTEFINASTGFFVSGVTFCKTTNGGVNYYLSPGYGIYDIYVFNEYVVYAVGGRRILKTTDGGLSWEIQYNGSQLLAGITFTSKDTGYACGEGGTILKTTNGGTPIGIKPISTKIPAQFYLYQNYPNPFNPVTRIKFDIPLLRGVSAGRGVSTRLIVYDPLGREVATLVNELLSPSTYVVEWDGTNFPSGVYFYSITVSDYKETKKLVLLK